MALLSRGELLQPDEIKIEPVYVDEENYVYVREMSAKGKDNFEQSLTKEVRQEDGSIDFQSDPQDYRAKLLVNTVCDDQGNLLLTYEDVQALSENKGARKIEKLVNKASSLNAVSKQDRDDMVKNSEADKTAGSNSDSAKS